MFIACFVIVSSVKPYTSLYELVLYCLTNFNGEKYLELDHTCILYYYIKYMYP